MFAGHPDTVMQIQTNREEARQLSKLIVKTMNDDEGKGVSNFYGETDIKVEILAKTVPAVAIRNFYG